MQIPPESPCIQMLHIQMLHIQMLHIQMLYIQMLYIQITLLSADETSHLVHLSKDEKIILKLIMHNKTRKYGVDLTVQGVDRLCDYEESC